MAEFNISIIKKGVEEALNEPFKDGKSILQWAEIGIHSQERSQWISVKDKLPDDASDVLAYYDCGDAGQVMFVNYYKNCWYDSVFNNLIDDLEQGCITHWMPLPEPPKEVKQNG